ncbi:MAG: hypothetical protein CVU38_19750 [Chloroflexi bacterium HGW-Chloroflexi-1]|nr:MAG: hypothetical protein CVU38_19750 [Chloroflexi bacterium HGW-Chloroflexi-1]
MNNPAYANFDLLLERAGGGSEGCYSARVIDSPAGQGSNDFPPPFTPEELADFPLANPTPALARDRGGRLFEAVFAGPVRDRFRASLHGAEIEGGSLRLRLRLVAVPALVAWPWEYLYDRERDRFLALSGRTPVVRYLDLPGRVGPLAVQPPLHMLVVIAQPRDYPPVEGEAEWMGLQTELASLVGRGLLVLERLKTPTVAALQRRLQEGGWHILHFVGHGGYDPHAGGLLVLEDGAGRGDVIPADRLAPLLHDERDTLRLAVLNACSGGMTAPDDAFSGTAQALVRGGIPAVLAAQARLEGAVAQTFAREFYAALAAGQPVDMALAEARKAIYARGGSMAWGALALYLRAADARLFDFGAGSATGNEEENMSKPDQADTGGGAFVGGNVDTGGGKFVGRDEIISIGRGGVYAGGDISGSTIVTGDDNVVGSPAADASLADLTDLLAQIRALLPDAGLDEDSNAAVTGELDDVEKQVARDKPNQAIVVAKLKTIAEFMAAAGGLAAAAGKLAPLVEKALQVAGQVLR